MANSIELESLPAPTLQPVRSHPRHSHLHPLHESVSRKSASASATEVRGQPGPDLEVEGGLHVTETASRADYTFPEVR